jgi:hypothetical protein
MSIVDLVQILTGIVAALTLFILLYQTVIQNRLIRAQILMFRFDMYKNATAPITTDEVKMAQEYPQHYFDANKYQEQYKGNPSSIKKYLFSYHLYEYMAYRYVLTYQLGLPEPIESNFKLWVQDAVREREFLDVHEYMKMYHQVFGQYVENIKTGKA